MQWLSCTAGFPSDRPPLCSPPPCRERLPANLVQAQRDFFGSHTYQRTDKEGWFHTVSACLARTHTD